MDYKNVFFKFKIKFKNIQYYVHLSLIVLKSLLKWQYTFFFQITDLWDFKKRKKEIRCRNERKAARKRMKEKML